MTCTSGPEPIRITLEVNVSLVAASCSSDVYFGEPAACPCTKVAFAEEKQFASTRSRRKPEYLLPFGEGESHNKSREKHQESKVKS